MIYLINEMSLPILMAVLMGAYFGWSSYTRETGTQGGNWIATGLLVFAIGCYVASAHLLPGRHGLYLEIALVLFASYLIGCTAGYVSHKWAGLEFDMGEDMALAGGPANAMHFTAQAAEPAAAKAAPEPVLTGPDDLTLIWGVGEKLARTLNTMGFDRFSQIAGWNEDDVARFEGHSPEFRGRVERDQWIEQCKNLASGWRPDNAVGERLLKN
jgi:predicted flap endonuclease-1-like 5' DNA nuclease